MKEEYRKPLLSRSTTQSNKNEQSTPSVYAMDINPQASSKPSTTDVRRNQRTARKRADIQASAKKLGLFNELLIACKRGDFDSQEFMITTAYCEVLFAIVFNHKILFLFKFGCAVGWDLSPQERLKVLKMLQKFQKNSNVLFLEEDEMSYIWSDRKGIKQDTIHLVSNDNFEKLAYSYAFAQCVKLAVFESNVDETIDRTRFIPESLARTGKVNATREDIGRRIGELFTSRFYINLHTDILDTPDIFWEFDGFSKHYSACRGYLEIPKRVEILNQRLDIIKDIYDMLNNELTIQHGHRLEWIVIYLVFAEVAIEIVWNIFVKDIFKLV